LRLPLLPPNTGAFRRALVFAFACLFFVAFLEIVALCYLSLTAGPVGGA